jgi:serine/threonine protein kinase
MNATPDDPATEDPRLVHAVQDYLAEMEAGRRPDRRAFAARYPDLTEAMAPYLEALDAVHAAKPELQQSTQSRRGPAPAVVAPDIAEPLGDFSIVREIGRGGMGVVYEAIQLSLGRRVALKVLPFAAALDARQLQRFKNEAQAAAHLHHTNIVPVYAVGCARGVHFYAMQLIEGQNLAVLVEELRGSSRVNLTEGHKGHASQSQKVKGNETSDYRSPLLHPADAPTQVMHTALGTQLTTLRTSRGGEFFRTVARLVVQAAEGLDYAHGLGIVHRDVKPANLLVDERGTVWITDFGLAQFHADAGLTQTGDLLGTLRYMSPEQAGGQRVLIDHHTDIYSLGATLYELLTLRPIFDGADRQSLLRQIINDEPRPLRAIDRTIPTELETIVLKAVSKVPGERYASAREFADDLQRYLRDEPILARAPTMLQRGRKWLRRHPSVPVAAAVLLLLLTIGSVVSAGFIRAAYQGEQKRTREAEERFRLARAAADDLIQLAVEDLAGKPFQEELRKRLLEKALVYYQQFIEQSRDDPEAQKDLADTEARVKTILDDLVLMQGAGQLFLLNEKGVLEDLQPSIEQANRIEELVHRLEERKKNKTRDLHRLSEKDRDQRMRELARANEADVAEVLTRGQRTRLGQIELQFKGLGAFRDATVARELNLTADQKRRIEGILAEVFMPPPFGAGPGFPVDPGAGRPGVPGFDWFKSQEEKRRNGNEKIQAVLTEAQKKKWREMIGEPYKGPMPGFHPGHMRPGGRHRDKQPEG